MDYTIQDLEMLPEEKRAEILYGKIFYMSAPTATHQEISGYLSMLIRQYIRKSNGKCRTYYAPFDVYLFKDDKTCLQPDIVVLCDLSKLDEKGCHGAPDWIIEITSPSTRKRDMLDKLNAYKDADVREYWVVDVRISAVTVYYFEGDAVETYLFSQKIPVGIFPDLFIKVEDYNKY